MKRLWVWCFCLPVFAATVPGRYIIELSNEPVAAHVAPMGKRGLRSQAAASRRALIHAGGIEVRKQPLLRRFAPSEVPVERLIKKIERDKRGPEDEIRAP